MKKKTQLKKTKKTGINYEEALIESLEESFSSLYGGGSPVQGISNRGSGNSVTTRSSHPFRSMTGPTGFDIDIIRGEEEATSKAPTLMPFPLDAVFDHITETLISLERIRILMKTTIESNSILHPDRLGKLKKMHKYIEGTIKNITTIGKAIEGINLEDI